MIGALDVAAALVPILLFVVAGALAVTAYGAARERDAAAVGALTAAALLCLGSGILIGLLS